MRGKQNLIRVSLTSWPLRDTRAQLCLPVSDAVSSPHAAARSVYPNTGPWGKETVERVRAEASGAYSVLAGVQGEVNKAGRLQETL